MNQNLVIGIGHSFRNDDGVGPAIARELELAGIHAVAYEGEGSGLLDIWDGLNSVTVIDAVSGPPAGAIWHLDDLPAETGQMHFVRSTHDLGLPEAVHLGRLLGRMPRALGIITISGADFSIGQTLSPAVRAAADQVVSTLTSNAKPQYGL